MPKPPKTHRIFLCCMGSVHVGSLVCLAKSSEIFMGLQNTAKNETKSAYRVCALSRNEILNQKPCIG